MSSAMNNLGLGFVLMARDEASETIHKVHENLDKVKEAGEHAHGSILKALGTSTVALAAAAAAVGVVATGTTFELAEHAEKFSSAILQAGVASHATAEQVEELERLAMNKGLDSLHASAIGAAEAIKQLALEGMNAKAAGEALDGTLLLMRISLGALDAHAAASIVNDTLGQFNMKASQAGELTDKLAFAMKNFGFRAEELRGTMSGLASGAQLTGASLDDTLIAVGLVKSVFPSATKAAASMNAAMQQLAGTNAQKELRGIGVSVKDQTGKILPLVDILEQLAIKTGKMTDAQVAHKLASIAGGRAAGGLSAIMEGLKKGVQDAEGHVLTGAAAIAYLREQMAHTDGTAKKMSDMLGSDLGGAIKALENGISNLATVVGKEFEEPWKHAVQVVNLFVRGVTQLFSQGGFSGEVKEALDKTENQGLKGFLIGLFMWGSRIKNFFTGLAASFESSFKQFEPVITELKTAFSALGQALGITGQSADDNASAFDKFGNAGASLGGTLAYVAGIISSVLTFSIETLTGSIVFLKNVWESIGPAVMNVFQVIKGAFTLLAGLFTGDWNMIWGGAIDVVVGAGKIMVNIVIGMVRAVTSAIDGLGAAFGKDLGLTETLNAGQREFMARVDAGTMVIKSAGASESHPGVVASQAQRASMSVPASAMSGGGDEVVHHHIPLYLDSEKVGEALARSKRSSDARSFMSVASGENGF